ncbi:glycosyltransferase family A protein [Telmatospirillum sp. J64-1]|uniref:glycosyltransferase family A protein n=1 Tax=Telmatospirillum sp. J64-1 TaxID=2502183 RepID=UPI00115DBBED|nr:glycosyltransferase family A protein [Telmatospirillum sp. J64-1]
MAPTVIPWKLKLSKATIHTAEPHSLNKELTVSLTSYPARFPVLPLTLKSILRQDISPDRIVLWIAHDDKKYLTKEIIKECSDFIEIRFCDDLGSYKKIIPTLEAFENSVIVTADDDTYYWPNWLRGLVEASRKYPDNVLCYRAHRIKLGRDGTPCPYKEWKLDIGEGAASPLTFPTGVGGVLYPSNVFHKDVLHRDIFETYCRQADDVWLYWMARLNGATARKIGPIHNWISWHDTQESGLWKVNIGHGRNDECIQSLKEIYGFPSLSGADIRENI